MEEMDLIKENTIKRYIKNVLKMRVSKTVPDDIRVRVNAILKKALKEAKKLAKEEDRSTIMPRDLSPSLDHALGKKKLSTPGVLKAIKGLSAIELGDLSKEITKFIQSSKQKTK